MKKIILAIIIAAAVTTQPTDPRETIKTQTELEEAILYGTPVAKPTTVKAPCCVKIGTRIVCWPPCTN